MVTTIKRGASEKEIRHLLETYNKTRSKKGIDVKKYCGIIHLKEDPLELQKKWRDEWK